jgi:nitrite reductase/ring-hydroxylating ferredoxin subunit
MASGSCIERIAMDRLKDPLDLCETDALIEGGKGVRFRVTAFGTDASAFVVRFGGSVYAYLNRCAHLPMELDWTEGVLFDSSGNFLMCATHGALYSPRSGGCVGGPCDGRGLHKIQVVEKDGWIKWYPDEFVTPLIA